MFRFGVDYCSEQWPEKRRIEDAHLMAEADVNAVRRGVFIFEDRAAGLGTA